MTREPKAVGSPLLSGYGSLTSNHLPLATKFLTATVAKLENESTHSKRGTRQIANRNKNRCFVILRKSKSRPNPSLTPRARGRRYIGSRTADPSSPAKRLVDSLRMRAREKKPTADPSSSAKSLANSVGMTTKCEAAGTFATLSVNGARWANEKRSADSSPPFRRRPGSE